MEAVINGTAPVERVPWTEELALKMAGNPTGTRAQRVDAIRDAVDDDKVPAGAVDALIAAGWRELAA